MIYLKRKVYVSVLLAAVLVFLFGLRVSPTLKLSLAGEVGIISYVYMVEHGTSNYRLITSNQSEIQDLYQDLQSSWNLKAWTHNGSFNESAYDIIFDDNDKPEDGHSGFITYLPQSDSFFSYDSKHDWLASMESSSKLKELFDRAIKK